MNWNPNRRELIAAGGAAVLIAAAVRDGLAQGIPASPEPGDIKMGIEPWLGYGQWHIAAKKGLFKQAGLDGVEIVNFTTDADINAALAAGQLQCGNIATHTAMNFIAAGPAAQDRGTARRVEDGRRHDLRRFGHRHQGPQGQAGRL